MNKDKLKVIILTHGGAERFLELLSDLESVQIVGVFVETATEKRRTLAEKLKRSIRYDGYSATVRKFAAHFLAAKRGNNNESRSVKRGQNDLVEFCQKLKIPVTIVEDYHSDETLRLLRGTDADLGVLYGTNIVRESVFSIPRLGSINLHQGLAPYYRGGPPVFWELFNGEEEIGITVHFVASKVDTGDIILQRTIPLSYDHSHYGSNYDEFLKEFRTSLKEPSAQLLTEAVRQIAEGCHKRIKQDTSLGKRYKLPIKSEKDQLLRLLKERHQGVGGPPKR